MSDTHMHNCDDMNPRPKPVALVVENEAIIRMETALMIKDAGYDALATCNADEAIAVLNARDDICAVFMEIRLPGRLNGLGLGRAIAERWPMVGLIMTSGDRRRDNIPTDCCYIPKPYCGSQIITALRALVPLSLEAVG
jgi:DNA-binding NtrC family response regulator